MTRTPGRTILLSCIAITIAVMFVGCGRNGNTATNPTPGPAEASPTKAATEPTPRTAFERDLQYVRNSQFAYVWIFSRKDGRALDKDDGAYLRTNAPQVIDWVTTDEGKKVIAGTNFDLEKGNLELLKKRFVVENHSGK